MGWDATRKSVCGGKRLRGEPRAERPERVDELKSTQEFRRDRDLAPVLGAELRAADPDGVEVDFLGVQREDLGDPRAGVPKASAKVWSAGCLARAAALRKRPRFRRGEVCAAAGVDQEDGLVSKHFR